MEAMAPPIKNMYVIDIPSFGEYPPPTIKHVFMTGPPPIPADYDKVRFTCETPINSAIMI